jgi:ABC-type Zn uptake system ZnuABC Zn-binding protein ZnuA
VRARDQIVELEHEADVLAAESRQGALVGVAHVVYLGEPTGLKHNVLCHRSNRRHEGMRSAAECTIPEAQVKPASGALRAFFIATGRACAMATVVLVALLAATGARAQARPQVAATIYPLYDIAREVTAGVADVVLILPPGASPHTFEPTPAGVRRLAACRAVFMIGHGLDDWAARMAAGVGVRQVLVVDEGIILRHAGSAPDPHYWLAVANAKIIAGHVAAEIARLAPDQTRRLRRTLTAYLARLDSTDAEIRNTLADLETRKIATFHDAFGYFAAAYDLDVAATFEPYPGKEPGPRWVRDFQRAVRATGLRVVFVEPQLAAAPLRAIARDLGVKLEVLDPLGGVPGRMSYIDLLRFNARQVAAAAP